MLLYPWATFNLFCPSLAQPPTCRPIKPHRFPTCDCSFNLLAKLGWGRLTHHRHVRNIVAQKPVHGQVNIAGNLGDQLLNLKVDLACRFLSGKPGSPQISPWFLIA